MSPTPEIIDLDNEARLRVLADRLECLTEQDFILLTDAAASTVQAWRKRGTGPDYVLVGNRYFYPQQAVARFMGSNVRQMAQVAKAAL